ncbi:hypothetical protein [Nocardia sp. NPDC006630]|uniref:hypothetical protein n=1 Tax=Nocardia sp. NPDC006630 TaxID=3157181 RepID=UPI0033A9EC8D
MRKSLWVSGLALAATAVLSSTGTASAAGTSMSTDSIFNVGTDIQAGTYTTTTALSTCAWARLSALTPSATAVLQTGGAVNGSASVTIQSTDIAFFTTGCGTWNLQVSTGSSSLGSGSASGLLSGLLSGTGSSS